MRGGMAAENLAHIGAQTGRGRVDDDRGGLWVGLAQLLTELGCEVAGEIGFGRGCVRLRGRDGVDVPIEADDAREFRPEPFREKARPTIGVDQE